ncbi:hypothetical protein VKT23_007550 [Stygiomarasmius scandens]|uniref:F-box domain-containing protein n=1 Tax=Marasmiellus scandens TaxID=2682957 RepID=A0ABR1JK65_9AGAR
MCQVLRHSRINDIPVELLQMVLLEVIPYVNCFPSPPFCHDSPASLLGVCRRWRDVIIETPKLWTRLLIRIPNTQYSKLLSQDNIRTWVERSKTHPLKLIIYSPQFSSQLQTGTHHLMEYAGQKLENIFFFYQADDGSGDFYSSLTRAGELPLLKEASIFVKGPHASEWWSCLVQKSPNLRSLTWGAFPGYLEWYGLSQIKRLEILWPISAAQGLYILACLTDLVELDIRIYNDARFISYNPDLPSSIRNHLSHNLKILRLYPISNSEDIAAFVNLLTLPLLTTLEIAMTVENYAMTWPQAKILSFLSRSSCSLTRLDLFRLDITEEQAIDLLQHGSIRLTLLDLVISRLEGDRNLTIVGDELLKLLTVPKEPLGDTEPVLPRLNTAVFAYTMDDATDGILSDMVKSRYPARCGTAPLEYLFILKHDIMQDSSRDGRYLRTASEDGLNAVVGEDCNWYSVDEKMSSNIKRILEDILG